MSTYWVKRIDQAALLADSFKLSILEQFADEPRTAKQVADRMDLKQTRLYRHIEALHTAGLLKLVSEQQKRGTVERCYQTVAKRFEIDSSMFSTGSSEENEVLKMVRGIMRDTEEEVIPLISDPGFQEILEDELAPLLMRLSMHGSKKKIALLREKLVEWIEACGQEEDDANVSTEDEAVSFRGLIMFYPQETKQK